MRSDNKAKVMFITPYPTEGPSNRYRVEQYFPYLSKADIEYDIYPFLNQQSYKIFFSHRSRIIKSMHIACSMIKRLLMALKVRNYDIVFVYLEAFPVGPPFLEWMWVKLMHKPIIYDFEDAIYLKRNGARRWLLNLIKNPRKFYGILRLSAHVIVCNNYMKELVSKYNQNVTIIPTSINTHRFTVKKASRSKNKVLLGWIGSHTTLPYLLAIKKPLERLAQRYDIALKVVGGGRNVSIPGLEVTTDEWSLENDVENFQSLDIGLYPLPHDERALAKTPFKTIQYMSVGIPVVASRAGAIDSIITDGINGLLIETEDEWVEKLSTLLEDSQARTKIGLEGRKTVEERFSLSTSAPKIVSVIMDVYKNNRKRQEI